MAVYRQVKLVHNSKELITHIDSKYAVVGNELVLERKPSITWKVAKVYGEISTDTIMALREARSTFARALK